MRQDNVVYFLLSDHLATTSVVVDAAGTKVAESRHYPYGEVRWTWPEDEGGTFPTDYRFTGQRLDAYIKLVQMGARHYDPALGRWLSADSIVPEPGNPQAFSRYSYVEGNPCRFTDPSGRCVTNNQEITRDDAFDCTVEELAGLEWEVRQWWLQMLADAAGANGWFDNIQDILDFFSEDSYLSDLDAWASWGDAAVLQAIQDGYRIQVWGQQAIGITGLHGDVETLKRLAELSTKAAGLWDDFFASKTKTAWARAEQAGVDYGIAVGDAGPGRGEGVQAQIINNFIVVGNTYRGIATIPYGGGIVGAGIGALCMGVLGAFEGFKWGEWFTDPRSSVPVVGHGPTYYSAWGVHGLTVAVSGN